MSLKRGPEKSGQPSKDIKYKCPVKDCESEYRGYEVASHFRIYSNLEALDKATETLEKLKDSKPCDVIEVSKVYLHGLLEKSSNSKKDKIPHESRVEHTLYLFHHSFKSTKLPTYNSVGFLCQQKKTPIAGAGALFKYFPTKVQKLSDEPENVQKLSDDTKNQNVQELSNIGNTSKIDQSVLPKFAQNSNSEVKEKSTDHIEIPPTTIHEASNKSEKNIDNLGQQKNYEIREDGVEIETESETGVKNFFSKKVIDWIAEKVVEKLVSMMEWIAEKLAEKLVKVHICR